MNKLFFLHTHYVPAKILTECDYMGGVLVPEFYPNLNLFYFDEFISFNSLEQYFDYLQKNNNYKSSRYYSIENLNMLKTVSELSYLKKCNVRILQLFHSKGNKYYSSEIGFSKEGIELLKMMEYNDMILDLSHLNEDQIKLVLDNFKGQVIVSHCSCSDLYKYDSSRSNSLSRNSIELLKERDALFGIAFLNDIISSDPGGQNESNDTLMDDLVNQVVYFIEMVGNRNVALGPDFIDLPYFSNIFRVDLKISECMYEGKGYDILRRLLLKSGFQDEDVENVFYRNAMNLLQIH